MPKKPKKVKQSDKLEKLFKNFQPEETVSKIKSKPKVKNNTSSLGGSKPPGLKTEPAPASKPDLSQASRLDLPKPVILTPKIEINPAPVSEPQFDRIKTAAGQTYKPVKRNTSALVLPEPKANSYVNENTSSTYSVNFPSGFQDWSTLRVIDETNPRQWTPDEELLVKQVSDQLSLALENAHLFEETQKRAGELATLNQIVLSVSERIELKDVLKVTYDEIKKLIPIDAFFVALYDEASNLISYPIVVDEDKYFSEPDAPLNPDTFSGKTILSGNLIFKTVKPEEVAANIADGTTLGNTEKSYGTLLFLPLKSGSKTIGCISIQSYQFFAYKQEDVSLLENIANQISIGIQNAQLYNNSERTNKELARRNEYLATSSEIGKLVTSTLDLNSIFARTVNLIIERFSFYHASIFIVEETGFNAVLRESTGSAGQEMKMNKHSLRVNDKSIVGKVVSEGQAVVVNDVTIDPFHKFNPLLPETMAEAAIPLRIGNRTIGAIDIQSKATNAFLVDEISVLQTVSDQVAVAIDNARSFELSQQAVMEMREVDRLKSQFLANMSHELRTPLNSIIGFSRVIIKGIDGPVTELQNQDLTAIYNSGQHLLGLINDILDLSKIEAGKMELAFDEVNIIDVTTSVISTMSGLIKDKPIQLKRLIPSNLPTVRADPIRIRQVMLNLLTNATKFTDEGDIVVEISLNPGPNGRKEMKVSVTDTGQGISNQDQTKLFQPFSQVDDSPTRKAGGTGLGLSICQHIINMHGGRIWVESEVGMGSTFHFTLQLFRKEMEGETSPGGNKVILAIDDDPQVIALYERYLKPQGYLVVPLSDPTLAMDRVKQLKPYAITLDIMMPGIDGWQILDNLKGDPETRDIPIIVCSIIDDLEKGFNLGATDYLVKPILEDDIVNSLDRINRDGSIRDVLVIDDDPDDLRLMGKILTDDGRYKAILAQGGRMGWEIISSGNPPHAVILDLFMPEMDGFKILENIQASEKLRDIPVIVISGLDISADQKNQLKEYGQRLLAKGSFNEKELLTSIQRSLERAPKKVG